MLPLLVSPTQSKLWFDLVIQLRLISKNLPKMMELSIRWILSHLHHRVHTLTKHWHMLLTSSRIALDKTQRRFLFHLQMVIIIPESILPISSVVLINFLIWMFPFTVLLVLHTQIMRTVTTLPHQAAVKCARNELMC